MIFKFRSYEIFNLKLENSNSLFLRKWLHNINNFQPVYYFSKSSFRYLFKIKYFYSFSPSN
jgi:hypothetical protein